MEAGQIPLLSLAANAMNVQRNALDIFARNLAAAQISGSAGFTRYTPQIGTDDQGSPVITQIREEHAAAGSIVNEMLAMMQAQRAYEGDATMFTMSKHLAEQTLGLERA